MDERFERALKKWPNVPALFGWLSLDRRGRWRIKGELISKPQIIDTIGRNYLADEHGRWYFQNGPQRGYMHLESAPLVLRTDDDGQLLTHTGFPVENPDAAYLDEDGAIWLSSEHGPAVLEGEDLQWALERIFIGDLPVDEDALASALAQPSGHSTSLSLRFSDDLKLDLTRLDRSEAPRVLGFEREPEALPDGAR